MAANVEKNDVEALMKGGEAEKAADFANYFSSYAFIYHQKQLLSDGARMRARVSRRREDRLVLHKRPRSCVRR